MKQITRFSNISVLGAAGKMGSGILLLNVIYISKFMFLKENRNKVFVINAIDTSDEALKNLLVYIRQQVVKYAEKNINLLRDYYAVRSNLIENSEIILEFVNEMLSTIRVSTNIEVAYNSHLIFEAVVEKLELKSSVLGKIKENSTVIPWFLTNTSSIPIHVINEAANLDGNIIGCHFYNPPAIQRLIEVIQFEKANKSIAPLVNDMAVSLNKVIVPSRDIAGFIGNGVFIREVILAIKELENLNQKYSFAESVVIIDTISRDILLRPMGIFQLVDYVGIDVCHFIIKTMRHYLKEEFGDPLLGVLNGLSIKGGQRADGSQKDGFYTYRKGKPANVYQLTLGEYININSVIDKVNNVVGELPSSETWKGLSKDQNRGTKLTEHFVKTRKAKTQGARFACSYIDSLKVIGRRLVKTGVAESKEDINKVMMLGFHQLYGPINEY